MENRILALENTLQVVTQWIGIHEPQIDAMLQRETPTNDKINLTETRVGALEIRVQGIETTAENEITSNRVELDSVKVDVRAVIQKIEAVILGLDKEVKTREGDVKDAINQLQQDIKTTQKVIYERAVTDTLGWKDASEQLDNRFAQVNVSMTDIIDKAKESQKVIDDNKKELEKLF